MTLQLKEYYIRPTGLRLEQCIALILNCSYSYLCTLPRLFPPPQFPLFWPLLRFCSLMASLLLPLLLTFILCSKLKALGLPTFQLDHHSVFLSLRSLSLNVPHIRRVKVFLIFPHFTLSLLPVSPFLSLYPSLPLSLLFVS